MSESPKAALALVLPLIGTVAGLVLNWSAKGTQAVAAFWVAIATAIWLGAHALVSLLSARHKDKKQKAHESPADITGCIHVMYSVLKHQCRIGDSEEDRQVLRITVYSVEKDELQQCVPYIGGDGGVEGRKFSIRSGIVGRAALTGKTMKGERANDDSAKFIDEMIHKWSFKKEEAEAISASRREWMAIPIKGRKGNGEGGTIGVVFLDSNKSGFFTKKVQEVAAAACSGLTSFVEERSLNR